MEALGMVDQGAAIPFADYDPLREDAQGRGSEYDARLNAMYNQLQGSIRDDGKGLKEGYQEAIDSTGERSQQAKQDIQGASDAANERNLQQLEALGIGEAAGNIVAEGRDLNSDTARAVQDTVARGQLAGNALTSDQAGAVTHNTNLVGAAGLEGNLQRARVQSELSSLLAQYDMEEQQANQQITAQNAQAQSGAFSQAMSLANSLTGDQWQQQGYKDDLAQMMYEQEAANAPQQDKLSQSMSFLQQLMASEQFADQDMEAILPYIQALGGIGKLV
jgi:hypothetical protein